MNNKHLFLVFAGITAVSACGGKKIDDDPALNYTVYKSSLAREGAPQLGDSEFIQLTTDNNQFGLDLYSEFASEEADNIFFSPYSISTALAMTYAGAAGDTKVEMAQALNFNLDDDVLHSGFNKLLSTMDSRNLAGEGDWKKPLTLKVNNTIWPDLEAVANIKDDYLDTLSVNYGAGVYALDYKNKPDESRIAINDAVADWTNDIIKDLLPAGDIKTSTLIALTNTIYMYAPWQSPFTGATNTADFHNYDGTTSQIDMMHNNTSMRYVEHTDLKVLAIPYRDADIELVVLLPSAGEFDNIEQQLSTSFLQEKLVGLVESQLIALSLPKFSLEFDADLIPAMKNLGMKQAFTDNADFSGIGLNMTLTAIKHKAFLDINEAGTEAAAATVVVGGPTSVPVVVGTANVDRPFIFAIHDRPTGNILFVGRVKTL